MRFRFSISLRLTLWFSAIFLCGFILFGALLLYFMNASVNSSRDLKLKQRAERMVEAIRRMRQNPAGSSQKDDDLVIPSNDGHVLKAYWLDGKYLKRDRVAEVQFPWPAAPVGKRELRMSTTFNGQTYRVYVLATSLDGTPLHIFVGRVLMDNPGLLDEPIWILIRFIPAMLLVSALAGYFISRRALMPVVRLTESARSVTIGNLAARLPVSPAGDELAKLAETCNEMLSRLEEAVKRITQFTADASHELRSPIAFIRTTSEDALRIPGLDPEAIQAFTNIVSETEHSSRLLEDMLLLARFDAGRAPIAFEPVSLTELVEGMADRMHLLAAQKQQCLVVRLPGGNLELSGDAPMLRRLVRILVENAMKYTPSKGTIEVALVPDGERGVLTVADNGPGIPQALLSRVFDRFFRVDPSRGEQDGTGLGLAIAKWIAETHRAEIAARNREGAGVMFEVAFPLISTTAAAMTTVGH